MNYWVVKGPPSGDSSSSLRTGKRNRWQTKKLPKGFSTGDRLFFLESLPSPRLVRLGCVERISKTKNKQGEFSFRVAYPAPLFSTPITVDELRSVPVIASASFLKSRSTSTLLPLTSEQAQGLIVIIGLLNPWSEFLPIVAHWLRDTDPELAEKFDRVLDLYLKIYHSKRFAGQIISFTGSGPQNPKELEELIRNEGAVVGGMGIWQNEMIIVIGREGFDREYLEKTIELIKADRGFTCSFLSQEDFWNYYRFERGAGYYRGDPRIKNHPGLSILASIGFQWPSTQAVQGPGGASGVPDWNEESPLKKAYGYNVQKRTPVFEREGALRKAIQPDGLGLRWVAEHIAWLIRLSKVRHDELFKDAIERWEEDLEWLRVTYYENSIYSFVWPAY